MIFIEFVGGKAGRLHMEFHPLVTVVQGLNEAQRKDMAKRLRTVVTGVDVGFRFMVDIGGVPQELTPDALRALGLVGKRPANLVRAKDLPGARVVEIPAEPVPVVPAAPPGPVVPTPQLRAARAQFDAAQERLADAQRAFDRMRSPRQAIDPETMKQLSKAHEAARDRVGELRAMLDELPVVISIEEIEARIERLQNIANAIRERTKELRVAVERLAPAKDTGQPTEKQKSALALAEEWATVEAALTREFPQSRVPQWLIDQARDELDSARERVEEMKDIGVNSQPFLDAQLALSDAQAVWAEVERGAEDPSAELRLRRTALYRQAVSMLGVEVDTSEVEYALRELPNGDEEFEQPLDANPERDRLQRELAASILDHQDVLHEMRELRSRGPQDAPTAEQEERRAELVGLLHAAEAEETELGERFAELQVAARRTSQPNPHVLAGAQEAVDSARSEVEAFHHEVVRLTRLLEGPAPEPVAPRGPRTELDLGRVEQEAVEMFVLSAVANLRQYADGESIPLVIDAAFDRLQFDLQLRLLNLLSSVASTVQIIYLTASTVAVEWAERQNELSAAVVSLERS